MSERAAFNAAFEAWSAGAGSELWMEEDIRIIKNDSFQRLRMGQEGDRKGMNGKEILKETRIIVGQVSK